jgi:hypothetical protein
MLSSISAPSPSMSLDERFKNGSSDHSSDSGSTQIRTTELALTILSSDTDSAIIPSTDKRIFCIVPGPSDSSMPLLDFLKVLFTPALPQSVHKRWLNDLQIFPQWNQALLTPIDTPRVRPVKASSFALNLSITRDLSSRQKMQDLFSDRSGHWLQFMAEVDRLIDEALELTHCTSDIALSPDHTSFYYKRHLAIRLQLVFLTAVVFHDTRVRPVLQKTSVYIGSVAKNKQRLHHSAAPNPDIADFTRYLTHQIEGLNLHTLKAELFSVCRTKTSSIREQSETRPPLNQMAKVVSLISKGVSFTALVRGWEEYENESIDLGTFSSRLLNEHVSKAFISNQSLFFLLQNCTYAAPRQLNILDNAFEIIFRKDLMASDQLFAQICQGSLSPSDYAEVMMDRLATSIEKECAAFIHQLDNYPMLISHLQAIEVMLRELCSHLEALKKAHTLNLSKPRDEQVEKFEHNNKIFDLIERLKKSCQTFEDKPEVHAMANETTVRGCFSFTFLKTLHCKLCGLRYTPHIFWQNEDSALLDAFIAQSVQDSLTFLQEIHQALLSNLEQREVMASIPHELREFLKSHLHRLRVTHAPLSPEKQLYFQHLLGARILPLFQIDSATSPCQSPIQRPSPVSSDRLEIDVSLPRELSSSCEFFRETLSPTQKYAMTGEGDVVSVAGAAAGFSEPTSKPEAAPSYLDTILTNSL